MTLQSVLFQALNGLASASGLFFVGAGLSRSEEHTSELQSQ